MFPDRGVKLTKGQFTDFRRDAVAFSVCLFLVCGESLSSCRLGRSAADSLERIKPNVSSLKYSH